VSGKTIVWKHLVAQERVKDALGAAFLSGNLGHAYLFCGDEGVGKFAAALDLSLALLCTGGENRPCYTCAACRKVLSGSHPDLHVIFPVLLDDSHKSNNDLNPKGWEFIASLVPKRVKAPYVPLLYENEEIDKSALHKVPAIPVEWIKEINKGILRGAVEGERSVTIFCDVDTMNVFSANAMLKTLEEPPANTYMILTTYKPESVLPTIASRCQIVRFGHVSPSQIKEQLNRALGPTAGEEEIKRAVFYSMGSLGRALAIIKTEESSNGLKTLQESARDVKDLWELCFKGDWLVIASAVDAMAKERNYAVHEQFFTYMLYLIRNSFLQKNGCSENYIDASDVLDDLAGVFARQESSEQLTRACNDAISSVKAYGNIAIILVNFVMTVMEIIHGEKQQAG
jgi:DNA polymerase III delta prime subunit